MTPPVVFPCRTCQVTVRADDIVALETAEQVTGVYGTCLYCGRVVCRVLPKAIVDLFIDTGMPTVAHEASRWLESLEV